MNEQEVKRMVGAICPDLNLDGCYRQIMPRVTAEQLSQLLDVAERGHNAPMWSGLATRFLLRYGQKELVATHRDRLVAAITRSYNAAWALVKVPHLTDKTRDALVNRVTGSEDAAWALTEAINLSDESRDALVPLVKRSYDAAWVLREAPNLSDEQRAHLEKIAG